MDRPDRTGERLLLGAAVAAFAHAIPSLYWAVGGTLGMDSLGTWAPAWRAESPVLVGIVLLGIFLAKAAGGIVPILATRGRLPRPRLWVALSWAGACVLVLYGIANVGVGGLALLGAVHGPADPVSRAALVGHVLLWDPLFLVWGLLLAAGLARSRKRTRRTILAARVVDELRPPSTDPVMLRPKAGPQSCPCRASTTRPSAAEEVSTALED